MTTYYKVTDRDPEPDAVHDIRSAHTISAPALNPTPVGRRRGPPHPRAGRRDPGARLHPERRGPFPLLVFFHGGGWVIGSLDTHDGFCRALAAGAGVRGRVGRLPAGARAPLPGGGRGLLRGDALGAPRTPPSSASMRRGSPSAATAPAATSPPSSRRWRATAAAPRLRYQLLVYPVTDCDLDTPSYRDNAEGYLLTADDDALVLGPLPGDDPRRRASRTPRRCARRARGPAAGAGHHRGVRSAARRGRGLRARPAAAGVPATLSRYDGMIHGFFGMGAMIDRAAQRLIAEQLRAAWG